MKTNGPRSPKGEEHYIEKWNWKSHLYVIAVEEAKKIINNEQNDARLHNRIRRLGCRNKDKSLLHALTNSEPWRNYLTGENREEFINRKYVKKYKWVRESSSFINSLEQTPNY